MFELFLLFCILAIFVIAKFGRNPIKFIWGFLGWLFSFAWGCLLIIFIMAAIGTAIMHC